MKHQIKEWCLFLFWFSLALIVAGAISIFIGEGLAILLGGL